MIHNAQSAENNVIKFHISVKTEGGGHILPFAFSKLVVCKGSVPHGLVPGAVPGEFLASPLARYRLGTVLMQEHVPHGVNERMHGGWHSQIAAASPA